mmetsp:Transcript_106462/g.159242  ORF Transcript_106462/g.159242 Transcript_106462/m.159242 type:complete len:300 (+) Transcript_106462:86-985(+)
MYNILYLQEHIFHLAIMRIAGRRCRHIRISTRRGRTGIVRISTTATLLLMVKLMLLLLLIVIASSIIIIVMDGAPDANQLLLLELLLGLHRLNILSRLIVDTSNLAVRRQITSGVFRFRQGSVELQAELLLVALDLPIDDRQLGLDLGLPGMHHPGLSKIHNLLSNRIRLFRKRPGPLGLRRRQRLLQLHSLRRQRLNFLLRVDQRRSQDVGQIVRSGVKVRTLTQRTDVIVHADPKGALPVGDLPVDHHHVGPQFRLVGGQLGGVAGLGGFGFDGVPEWHCLIRRGRIITIMMLLWVR